MSNLPETEEQGERKKTSTLRNPRINGTTWQPNNQKISNIKNW